MHKGRLEAFTDGVMAIVITIMVLEMKVPHGAELANLWPLLPKLVSYVLSFFYIGIYWNNHHHMFQASRSVDGGVLWANLHLLFWLSLLPFATGWLGENGFARNPMMLYGVILFMADVAYFILARRLVTHHGKESRLGEAFGRDFKGKISLLLTGAGVVVASIVPWLGFAAYSIVALIWLIPDRRMHAVVMAARAEHDA